MPLLAFSLSLSLSLSPSLSLTRTHRTFFLKHTRFGEIMITCRRGMVTCFFVVLLTQSNRGTFLTVFGSSLVQKICVQHFFFNLFNEYLFCLIYFILFLGYLGYYIIGLVLYWVPRALFQTLFFLKLFFKYIHCHSIGCISHMTFLNVTSVQHPSSLQ